VAVGAPVRVALDLNDRLVVSLRVLLAHLAVSMGNRMNVLDDADQLCQTPLLLDRRLWQVLLVAPRKAKPSHKALGRSIRAAREEKRLTQMALAERAGLHPTYLSGVETGQRNVSWTALSQIAQALGMPISELAKRAEQ